MKLLHFSLVLATACLLSLSACLNPCKDVKCENGGTCADGTCDCPNGYEGSDCSELARDKFLGVYEVTENCSSGFSSYEVTFTVGNGHNKINIWNLYDLKKYTAATVNGAAIVIPEQSIDFATVSGAGSYSEGRISLQFELSVNTVSDNCWLDAELTQQ